MSDSTSVDHPWADSSCAYLSFHVVNDMAQLINTLALCDAMRNLGMDTEILLSYPDGVSPHGAGDLREHFGLDNEPTVTWFRLDSIRWIARARLTLASYRAGRRHTLAYTRKALFALGALVGGARAVILEVHEPDVSRHGRLALELARHSRRLHIVCTSRILAELVAQDYGLDESTVIVEHNGTKFPIRRDYTAETAMGRRLVATYVGTCAPGRGLEIILAMAEQCPEVDFVVVGGELPTSDVPVNMRVPGRVAHGEVAAILAQADILLLSYTRNVWRPGGGRARLTGDYSSAVKMFEYLAAGRAIIASDLPAIAEILVDGSNALLADQESVDEWVNALRRLASDPALRVRLARGATETAEHHTLEQRVCRILDEVWSRP